MGKIESSFLHHKAALNSHTYLCQSLVSYFLLAKPLVYVSFAFMSADAIGKPHARKSKNQLTQTLTE